MNHIKCCVLALISLVALVASFALGRYTSAKVVAEPRIDNDDPLLSMPTKVDTIYVPLPRETVKEMVPMDVDTGAIIEAYFSRHVYRDTLRASAPGKLGGSAVAVIHDTIAHNVIAGRTVSLTFTPNRLATTRSVDLLSTWGLGNTSVLAGYRYGRWTMYAGYNFSSRAPTAGVGYRVFNW